VKILVPYDGSEPAAAAIRDLTFAGLPDTAQCTVLSIADVWLPDAENSALDPALQSRILAMRETARSRLAQAEATAGKGAEAVRALFKGWEVSAEAVADSPAWGILKLADSRQADLIVMGAHGMSAVARIVIGSVSRKVVSQSKSSVRIARNRPRPERAALRLVVAFDGSADAKTVLQQLASRQWPPGTEVQVVTAVDDTMRTAVGSLVLDVEASAEAFAAGDDRVLFAEIAQRAAEQLRRAGCEVTAHVAEGDPKHVLLRAAEEWEADCIFVGATGLRGLRRLLLGSVATAVTASAHCSVEVVRAVGEH
jgi:nucleotide-binding universal stress UspA family protein